MPGSSRSVVQRLLAAVCVLLLLPGTTLAQDDVVNGETHISIEETPALKDSADLTVMEMGEGRLLLSDTLPAKTVRDWATWRPSPQRALWLALVLPGAGQIYNRKYWKLPIIYGGFVGSIYAMNWNNQMYRDYSQAYLDIMDSDPTTQSYNQFLHLGTRITSTNEERYKTLFKKRKDYYRRYRDLSFFVLVGVYALSVIDAYVDASLSEFDISKDLSMRMSPAVIGDQMGHHPLKSNALGLQCSITF